MQSNKVRIGLVAMVLDGPMRPLSWADVRPPVVRETERVRPLSWADVRPPVVRETERVRPLSWADVRPPVVRETERVRALAQSLATPGGFDMEQTYRGRVSL